ncbi:hypothetical protein GDO81_004062, partial [Engystomops pustulosus]
SSTVDPKEKLEIILKTYQEIEKTVSRVLGRDYKLPMDDLLPLLIYVVSRAGLVTSTFRKKRCVFSNDFSSNKMSPPSLLISPSSWR